MPVLYIITGSNGAGKSSVGPDYVPSHLSASIFDGDKLFMQQRSEFWISGIRSHKECKKLAAEVVQDTFDRLVEAALVANTDFAYEGHFTNDATWGIPKRFKDAGYSIHLIFFGLTDTALSEIRVVAKAQEGGHYVDPITLSANFYGNLEKLDKYYAMFDSVEIIDTSGIEHAGLAILEMVSAHQQLRLMKCLAGLQSTCPTSFQQSRRHRRIHSISLIRCLDLFLHHCYIDGLLSCL